MGNERVPWANLLSASCMLSERSPFSPLARARQGATGLVETRHDGTTLARPGSGDYRIARS